MLQVGSQDTVLVVVVLILLVVSAAVTWQLMTGKSVVKVDEATAAQAAYYLSNAEHWLSVDVYL